MRGSAAGNKTDLRKTAPNFYDQARTLTERQKFAEALDKIDTAIALDDTKAEFHERLDVVNRVERHVLAPAGHMLHHDQPEALARLLEDFLAP